MATYWENRMIQLYESQDKRNSKLDKKMRKEYHRIEVDLQKEMASYYQKYGVDQVLEYRKMVVELSPAERDLLYKNYDEFSRRYPQYKHLMPIRESIYKLNRIEGLHLSIRMQMVELGAFEQEGFDNLLRDVYERGYLSTMKGLGNAQSFFNVNSIAMQQTLNEKWINSGNFSDRIWANKEKLINALTSDIRDGIIRGDSYQKMARLLQKRLEVGANDSLRLIVTESAFVLNQANKQAFMDESIKSYRITSVMDKRTSPTCRNLNGEKFDFKEAKTGVNYPPFHAWCRTTVVPIENTISRQNYEEKWYTSGALNDKNDPYMSKREEHAIRYYQSVRNRDKNIEISTISKNTGMAIDDISKVYDHVFINKYKLDNGTKQFDPSYDMAQSWQRLREGNNIQQHDLILLKHERLEYELMNEKGYNYREAHKATNKKYNYEKPLLQWLKERGDL